ncbi:unannotated protein [freshwater metagenome]|uniref:Unannotated protein n=1 Tax=freshwater metagenome TaxID=449393 RepID=A0A6J7FGE6_9ZZZZ|nr:DUF2786 domain-containing protein [Actinomycetota bacterium]
MGKHNQQRRAANARRAAPHQRSDGAPSQSPNSATLTDDAIISMLASAAGFAVTADKQGDYLKRLVHDLAALEIDPLSPKRPSRLLGTLLHSSVSRLYEAGWQPADIVHNVKRASTLRATRLIVAIIAHEARSTNAVQRAPQAWLVQLDDIGAYDPSRQSIIGGHDQPVAVWTRSEQLDADEMLSIGLLVLGVLATAPRQTRLMAPPSAWGASNRGIMPTPAASNGDIDAKALKLIRALLAKAEATTFEAEAETFTTKAQEMMTRYSIDAAVLASAARGTRVASGVESRRVHIESPYADEKAGLLSVIAGVNGARSIWSPDIGIATVMGFPVDLHLADLLFTSLLVQATHASAEATATDRRLRTPSFRRAFLIAFADRIGERLEATRQHASAGAAQQYGAALVPILANRDAAVDQAVADSFPNITTMASRQVNAAGWYAGRAAADRAHIGAGEAIAATSG